MNCLWLPNDHLGIKTFTVKKVANEKIDSSSVLQPVKLTNDVKQRKQRSQHNRT